MNYYLVTCKLGHSGTHRHREITFNIAAENASHAIDIASKMPGVKHNNNTRILRLIKITKEQYLENKSKSAYEAFKKEEDCENNCS